MVISLYIYYIVRGLADVWLRAVGALEFIPKDNFSSFLTEFYWRWRCISAKLWVVSWNLEDSNRVLKWNQLQARKIDLLDLKSVACSPNNSRSQHCADDSNSKNSHTTLPEVLWKWLLLIAPFFCMTIQWSSLKDIRSYSSKWKNWLPEIFILCSYPLCC